MKTPDELKASAKSWAWDIGSTTGLVILGIVAGALGMSLCHCDAFTPHVDPHGFPCGDPQAHWCPRTVAGAPLTCCHDGWDCGGSPEFPGCPAGVCCDAIELDAQRADGGSTQQQRPQMRSGR